MKFEGTALYCDNLTSSNWLIVCSISSVQSAWYCIRLFVDSYFYPRSEAGQKILFSNFQLFLSIADISGLTAKPDARDPS